MLSNAEENPPHSHFHPQTSEHQTPVNMMQWWMSQTFTSPLFIFGNQGGPADFNVTHLNRAWWNGLLRCCSQDLYVIWKRKGKKPHDTSDSWFSVNTNFIHDVKWLIFNGINKGNLRGREGGTVCVCDRKKLNKSVHTLFLFAQTFAICLTVLPSRRVVLVISASVWLHACVQVCV